jgi:chromosome segregation ATPase
VKHSQETEQLKTSHTQEIANLETKCQELVRFSEQQGHKILGLEQEKQKLENVIKENDKETIIIRTVKEEANNVNEELKKVQREYFCVLNSIHTYRDDQIRLNDQINEIKDKYKKAQEAFEKMINWQSVYLEPPSTLPKYNEKKKLKDQVLFDSWKNILEDIEETQS